ncbi:MAG TPA: c-type cytochrome [Bryobacteraceae bacterium]|nr:adenylate cyclase [Bryobacterales bacterium]HRJ17855.1 c-type cytochrome [Bryobacteraceae bacterium]
MISRFATALAAFCLLLTVPASAQKKGDAAKGKEVYEQCGVCHAHATDEKKLGPSLKGLYKKAKMHNGKDANDTNVIDIIKKGGNGMPGFEEILEGDELVNLIAYLKTL